ncbi:hypothetical protein ACIRD8_15095 [Streptomyces sp. NPDC102451]|uniref:hypothetical protein n=1 Tax=Streptomyces sp. NPDC102451 TaxID=3366177 RepID=UPI00382D1B39
MSQTTPVDEPSRNNQGAHVVVRNEGDNMLDMLTPNGGDHSKALEMINTGTIETTRTWVETSALIVTECLGAPFGKYYVVVVTDDAGDDDTKELHRLSAELGKPLGDCIIEKEHHDKPHRWFPGSQSFDLLTVYAG